MNSMRSLLALCLIPVFALGQASALAAKERTPDSVQSLPAEIRHDLDLRQCRIPKYSGTIDAEDQAYTTGHFRSRLSVDYAIVCHIPARKVQSILVYSKFEGTWSGEVITSEPFDPSPGSDTCASSVGVATPAKILAYARAFAPDELKRLPHLDHDGVEIDICEKASVIHYFSNGQWLQLQGAD